VRTGMALDDNLSRLSKLLHLINAGVLADRHCHLL
jgi:hypothetical protein